MRKKQVQQYNPMNLNSQWKMNKLLTPSCVAEENKWNCIIRNTWEHFHGEVLANMWWIVSLQ